MSLYEARDEGVGSGTERDFWRGAFEAVVERLPEPALVVDDAGRITHWNGASEAATNVDASDAIGRVASDVTGAETSLAERAVASGEVVRGDRLRTGTSAGGKRWHTRGVAVPIRDGARVAGAFELSIEPPRGRADDPDAVAALRRAAIGSAESVERSRVDADESRKRLRDAADAVGGIAEALAAAAERVGEGAEGDVDVPFGGPPYRTESVAALVGEAATLVGEASAEAEHLAAADERGVAALDDLIRALDDPDGRDDGREPGVARDVDSNGDGAAGSDGNPDDDRESSEAATEFGEGDWLPGFRRAD